MTKPESLDELEAQADVSIIVNDSRYLRAAVENREIDLAFAVQANAIHTNLDVEPIGPEPFVLVCRPDRLAGFQAALKTNKLSDFISYDRHSTTYGHIHNGLRKLGVTTPRPELYSTSPTIMLHTVLRGRGHGRLALCPSEGTAERRQAYGPQKGWPYTGHRLSVKRRQSPRQTLAQGSG